MREKLANRRRAACVAQPRLAVAIKPFDRATFASRRVESRRGSGVSSGRIISGSSVQPMTTASQPFALNLFDTSLK
jgi:hypothetical protein